MHQVSKVGIRCAVHIDADTQLVIASTMGKGDVAIALSYSGRSRTVVEAMRLAKENGATTICITKMEKSPLIKHCDIKLFTATTDVTIGKEIIARRIAEQAIMEALYLGLITKERSEYREYRRLKPLSLINCRFFKSLGNRRDYEYHYRLRQYGI